MDYEVAPRAIGGRRRRVVGPLLVGLVVVSVAALGALREAVEGSDPPPSHSLPARPERVDCAELGEADCTAALAAAQALLGTTDAPIVSVAADPSLLCGDDLDCPRAFLAGSRPVGSLVLTFDDGVVAWVNVVADDGTYSARVVRWFGAPP